MLHRKPPLLPRDLEPNQPFSKVETEDEHIPAGAVKKKREATAGRKQCLICGLAIRKRDRQHGNLRMPQMREGEGEPNAIAEHGSLLARRDGDIERASGVLVRLQWVRKWLLVSPRVALSRHFFFAGHR